MRRAVAAAAICLLAGCGGAAKPSPNAKQAELARERRAASYAAPPPAVVAAAGRTPEARNAPARAQLLRAARDLQGYHRTHGTYAIGPVERLHRLDHGVPLVDFVDGRQADFFLAVDPPTTTTTWRYNFDHDKGRTSCGPGGTGCPPSRRW